MRKGFTVVELLIVIVVIGILATLTIIAYSSVQNQARAASAKSDLEQAAKRIQSYLVSNAETYPASITPLGLSSSGGNTYTYYNDSSTNRFCLQSSNAAGVYRINSSGRSPGEGSCSVVNYALNPEANGSGTVYQNQTPASSTLTWQAGTGAEGATVFQVATTVAGQLRIRYPTQSFSVSEGEKYTGSFVLTSTVASASPNLECNIGSSWYAFPIRDIIVGTQEYVARITIPAGQTTFSGCQLLSTGSVAAGSVFRMSKSQLVKGENPISFADGNTSGWSWSGVAHQSTSSGIAY